MTAPSWAKQKTDELVFVALLANVPPDERDAYLTGMKLKIWEIEDAKKIANLPNTRKSKQ